MTANIIIKVQYLHQITSLALIRLALLACWWPHKLHFARVFPLASTLEKWAHIESDGLPPLFIVLSLKISEIIKTAGQCCFTKQPKNHMQEIWHVTVKYCKPNRQQPITDHYLCNQCVVLSIKGLINQQVKLLHWLCVL